MLNQAFKLLTAAFLCFGLNCFADHYEVHAITDMHFSSDPYTGNYIDEYIFTLEDNSVWICDWWLYEHSRLRLGIGDSVKIFASEKNRYVMITPDQQYVIFEKFAHCRYYAR